MKGGLCICKDDELATDNSNAGKFHKPSNFRPRGNRAATLPEIKGAGESLCILKAQKKQGLEMRIKKLKIMKIKEEAWKRSQIGNEACLSKMPQIQDDHEHQPNSE